MARKPLRALPLHHIDTSVLLEPPRTETGRLCKNYMQRVGVKYRGRVSIPVLGEIMMTASRMQDYNQRHDFLDVFHYLMRERKIDIYSPKNVADIDLQLQAAEPRLDPVDGLIVACAIEDNADTLVSINTKLAGNMAIKDVFGLRVLHPQLLV